MRKFILALIFPSFVYANSYHTPQAGAVYGTVYGYEVACWYDDVNLSDFNQNGLHCSYKTDGVWSTFSFPSYYTDEPKSKEDADAIFLSMVEQVNVDINTTLKPITTEPLSGNERVKWLTSEKLVFSNNQLTVL